MQDFCFRATTEAAIIAAMNVAGLTAPDEAGDQRPLGDYAYSGRVLDTPGEHDGDGNEVTPPTYLDGVYAAYRATDEQAAAIQAVALPDGVAIVEPPQHLPRFGGEWLAPDVDAARDAACTRLNARRDAIKYGVYVDSHGVRYDVHRDARDNFAGVESKIANGLELPEGFTWTDADNTERPHDNASFLALTMEILLWSQAVHAACVAAKRAVRDDAADLAGVATAEAAVSWP